MKLPGFLGRWLRFNAVGAIGIVVQIGALALFKGALQDTALTTWSGQSGNLTAAQRELVRRLKLNGLATTGAYASKMESQVA